MILLLFAWLMSPQVVAPWVAPARDSRPAGRALARSGDSHSRLAVSELALGGVGELLLREQHREL